ncbi:MAG: peptidylprolyl isomerase [Gemmataceae bacterium]|nr:peptidylprolyl isomerase [Gemmataceae bacterium]
MPSANPGIITGVAFLDADGSGTREAGESLLPGATIALTGTADDGTVISVATTTDANGAFRFVDVHPGIFSIRGNPYVVFQGGPTAAGADLTITTDGETTTVDIGFQGGLAADFISLRLFLSSSTAGTIPSTGGNGVASTTGRQDTAPFVKKAISDVSVAKNAADTVIDLAGNFDDADLDQHSFVQLNTSAGPIKLELFDRSAAQTVANYFNYINSGRYDNSIFHRLEANFVLQGGGFSFDASSAKVLNPITTDPQIKNEFGASNTAGTVAMAKQDNQPNSATSQFFFNLKDNPQLDTQNSGFTVFGKIADDASQQVVNTLSTLPVQNKGSTNSAFNKIPLVNYSGSSFPTDTTFANFAGIQSATVLSRPESLTYAVLSNSNTGLVTATIENNRLRLEYVADQTGTAIITVQATDRFGITTSTSFKVTVS